MQGCRLALRAPLDTFASGVGWKLVSLITHRRVTKGVAMTNGDVMVEVEKRITDMREEIYERMDLLRTRFKDRDEELSKDVHELQGSIHEDIEVIRKSFARNVWSALGLLFIVVTGFSTYVLDGQHTIESNIDEVTIQQAVTTVHITNLTTLMDRQGEASRRMHDKFWRELDWHEDGEQP